MVSDQLVPAGGATAAMASPLGAAPSSLLPQAARVRDRAIRTTPDKAFTTGKTPIMGGLTALLDQRATGGNAAWSLPQSDPATSAPLMVKPGVPLIFTLFHASSVIAMTCFIAMGLAMQAFNWAGV